MNDLILKIVDLVPYIAATFCGLIIYSFKREKFYLERDISRIDHEVNDLQKELIETREKYISEKHLDKQIKDVRDELRTVEKNILEKLELTIFSIKK